MEIPSFLALIKWVLLCHLVGGVLCYFLIEYRPVFILRHFRNNSHHLIFICVLGCIHKLHFLSYQIITSFIIKWWNRMEVIYLDLFSSSIFSACVRWLCCNSLNFWNSQCCFSNIYLQITTFIQISQLCLYLILIKPE